MPTRCSSWVGRPPSRRRCRSTTCAPRRLDRSRPGRAATCGSQTITLVPSVRRPTRSRPPRRRSRPVPKGILQNPTRDPRARLVQLARQLELVVDVRSPSVDIVHDDGAGGPAARRGLDPAAAADAARGAARDRRCTYRWSCTCPRGHTESYDAVPGSVKTLRVANGGTDWDRVVDVRHRARAGVARGAVPPRRGRGRPAQPAPRRATVAGRPQQLRPGRVAACEPAHLGIDAPLSQRAATVGA